uniref:Laccase-1 n=1 Tax=Cacopsylla melanoneura TaxID=428564 RepID=A0A8D9F7Q8_9HEMI
MIRLVGFFIILAVQNSFYPAKAKGFGSFPRAHSFPLSSSYSQYLQPDDIDSGKYDSPNYVASNLCVRACEGSAPKTCYFKFTLEAYSTLNQACGNCTSLGQCTTPNNPQCILGDGYERPLLAVNRRMTGPSIQACKGDTIVVDVANMMPGRTTTIHWHGLTQKATPYMDGVPMVTQCPIVEGTIFRYKYLAETAGTYFWHAHDGFQKMDGVIGSLIIRQPRALDPNNRHYQADLPSHVILVTDWFHNTTSDDRWPGLRQHDSAQLPDTFLLNGKGRAPGFQTPLAEFVVKPNTRYRFRFIGGTCLVCPFQVSVEGHQLTLISMDKSAVEPITVDSFAAGPGERYDFVIETSKAVSSYWIHVKGIGPCETTTKAFQLGVLRYEGSRSPRPPGKDPGYVGYRYNKIFNLPNADCNPTNTSIVCISHLNNKETINPVLLAKKPDVRILLAPGFRGFKLTELFQAGKYPRHFVPVPTVPPLAATINNISNVLPSSPLLSQYKDIPQDEFCSQECLSNNSPTLCHCLDLIPVPKNQLIELVIADSGGVGLTHPMHLHGYCYYVMAQGVFPPELSFDESIQFLNQELNSGLQVRPYPPMKDTVPLPSKGYFVLRIYSDNPGFWFFHCHFLYHHQTGMSAVIQVGELSDMVTPPHNFPKCGNFYP